MDDMGATLDRWYGTIIDFLPNLLLIALILVVTLFAARRVQGIVRRASGRTEAPPELINLLGRMARIGVLALGGLLVLNQLNLSGAFMSFIAGLGIAGIIIAFALQDIVKNFAAGVLLLMMRPFRLGDEVKIGAFEGRVMEVQLRATVLKANNGDEVLIPNADVYTTAIIIKNRYDLHRQDIELSVPAEIDLAQARAALMQAIADVPGIAGDPAPVVIATGFDGQAAKIEVRFWTDGRANNADAVKTDAIAAIRRALDQADGDTATRRHGDAAT